MKKLINISLIFISGVIIGAMSCYLFTHFINKNKSKAMYYLGIKEFESKNFDSSVAILNQAIAIDEKQYGPYYLLGIIYQKKGNIDFAKKMYNFALEFAGDDKNASYDKERISQLLEELGRKKD